MGTTETPPSTPTGDEGLRELYQLYTAYALKVYHGDKSFCRNYDDFVAWWQDLPDPLRAEAEAKYRKGYDRSVSEGASAVRRRRTGA